MTLINIPHKVLTFASVGVIYFSPWLLLIHYFYYVWRPGQEDSSNKIELQTEIYWMYKENYTHHKADKTTTTTTWLKLKTWPLPLFALFSIYWYIYWHINRSIQYQYTRKATVMSSSDSNDICGMISISTCFQLHIWSNKVNKNQSVTTFVDIRLFELAVKHPVRPVL